MKYWYLFFYIWNCVKTNDKEKDKALACLTFEPFLHFTKAIHSNW